jgi:hypothetical protein
MGFDADNVPANLDAFEKLPEYCKPTKNEKP